MDNVLKALKRLRLRKLITIGGDDTAFSASRIAERAGGAIRVAHVPKTIDNDLPLPGNMPTFGFQTARAVGAQLVAHLVEDARTTQRWYVVVTMGRSAGHLALGIGAVAGASLTLIPEEFGAGASLGLLCDIIEGTMIKRKARGRSYGVAVVAEGVAELMQEELKKHPLVKVKTDHYGNLRLAEVPLALILKRMLQERAARRGEEVTLVDVTLGYELRCADPIWADAEYVQQLGWGAVRYLLAAGKDSRTGRGAMISIQAGEVVPIRFSDIIDRKTGKTSVRRVNVNSDPYRCARSYMLRLERSDFESAHAVKALAAAAGITPGEFRKRYSHVAKL
jgi:6-phosphofructokinase 1